MRGQLGKVLRQEFESRLEQQYPQFTQERIVPNPIGLRLYVWEIREDLNVFILLFPSPKRDCFTLEIGSSDDHDFDGLEFFMSRDVFPPFKTRSRISFLYEPKQDYWWYLSKTMSIEDDFFTFVEDTIGESLTKVGPSLNDVFEKIETYAIPYFKTLGAGRAAMKGDIC